MWANNTARESNINTETLPCQNIYLQVDPSGEFVIASGYRFNSFIYLLPRVVSHTMYTYRTFEKGGGGVICINAPVPLFFFFLVRCVFVCFIMQNAAGGNIIRRLPNVCRRGSLRVQDVAGCPAGGRHPYKSCHEQRFHPLFGLRSRRVPPPDAFEATPSDNAINTFL